MITTEEIKGILSLYEKHGWNISRVLLCNELSSLLGKEKIDEFFGNAEITESEINAVWFCRPAKHGNIAWELRHLSNTPFAIFELFDESIANEEKIEELKKRENRLIKYASNKMDV